MPQIIQTQTVVDMESLTNTTPQSNSTARTFHFDSSDSGIFSNTAVEIVFVVLSLLGFLGNVLVMAVNARRLTTSTKVYMFSLALVDATICLGAVTGSRTERLGTVFRTGIVYIVTTAAAFSMYMLAFVATERYVAVKRPHAFSLSSRRATIAVILIGIGSAIYAAVVVAAKVLLLDLTLMILRIFVVTSTVVVIVVCYVMIAALLWIRARDKAKRGKASQVAPEIKLSIIHRGSATQEATVASAFPTASGSRVAPCVQATVASTVVAHKKTQGTLSLVFGITALYIFCWLPFWLYSIGVPMHTQLIRLYLLHPILNPLAYNFLSPMFREDLRHFCLETRTKLLSCWHRY